MKWKNSVNGFLDGQIKTGLNNLMLILSFGTLSCLFQILGLLLVNDNGSTARYIRKHHLVR